MASTSIAEPAVIERVTVDPQRVEESALNALQTQRQLFYDGWLLRLSAGSAKRARSTAMQSAAHHERLSNTPLVMHAVIARSSGGEIVGCGQVAIDASARGVYAKFGFATLYTYHYRARPSECF